MPVPDHELTLNGGCNCGSIRYRVDVPELAKRPYHPAKQDIQFPMIATDHCNDCRKATGSVISMWLCVPATMLSVRLRPAPTDTIKTTQDCGSYHPSMTALRENSAESLGSTLRWYVSSPQRTRTFCGHCGTNVTYAIFPLPEGDQQMFEVVLGTLDREDISELRKT